jgi:predicted dehydrogenase
LIVDLVQPSKRVFFQRALVVGAGSIGFRHLRNLRAMHAVEELAVVDPDASRRDIVSKDVESCRTFATLEEGLDFQPEVAFIATPTHLHVSQALEIARRDIALFVEKPLSSSIEELQVLVDELRARKLTSQVGCNMRFHPGPMQVKRLLDERAVGSVLFARLHCGSYLPDWRPWQDYRQSYSANRDMGGGVILDSIHEIDLARWFLGTVASVFCVARKVSALQLDVEDTAILVMDHKNGAMSEVHLDYVQRTYERGCQVVGEHGTIFWEFGKGEVRWYDARHGSWTVFPQPDDWNTNHMYVDEIVHFLEHAVARTETDLPVAGNVHVVKTALAAKKSAAIGGLVKVPQEDG